MNTGTNSMHSAEIGESDTDWSPLDRLARRVVLSRLEKLQQGQILFIEDGVCTAVGHKVGTRSLSVEVHVLSPKFYRQIAFQGAVGAGEAYIHGYWACSDLRDLLRILLQNREVLENVSGGLAMLGKPILAMLHALHRNTRKGSRKNISAHYDLGNPFYQLWLDPTMMYSCAYFDSAEKTLEEAATEKLDRICQKLDLSAGDSIIEIGTGWGGFAIHAARHYGCHITTTTISRQQYEFARQAVVDAGVEDRVTLLLKDYRDLEGRFDKLVSIEMIEAVGHEYHDRFFRKCAELLKPNGQMLLQAITMADQHYDSYKTRVDFIKRYIFPGGCLTSVTGMAETMTRHTDLRTIHLEDIGPHYARTLRHWRARFNARLDDVRELGYSESFIRMWEFYLVYCEAAFMERAIGTVQLLAVRPGARREKIEY